MTPTEQAAAILKACGISSDSPLRLVASGISATAIREAVDQVLYEHPLSTEFRNEIRAQFLAIADALYPPAAPIAQDYQI